MRETSEVKSEQFQPPCGVKNVPLNKKITRGGWTSRIRQKKNLTSINRAADRKVKRDALAVINMQRVVFGLASEISDPGSGPGGAAANRVVHILQACREKKKNTP